MVDTESAMAARGVYRSFPGVQALSDVTIEFPVGMVTALVGENGAGKSTLMRILAGLDQPNKGVIERNGVSIELTDSSVALRNGIALIPQEINLASDLSAVDNIVLNHEPNSGKLINTRKERLFVQGLMDRVGLHVPLGVPTGKLEVSQQRIVEILRALSHDADVVIMDEATAALGFAAAQALRIVTRTIAASGKTVIYVSHHLDEVLSISDQIVVLRDGRVVSKLDAARTSSAEITEHMLGRPLSEHIPIREPRKASESVAEISNISQNRGYSDISFSIQQGEIVGITGLVGCGAVAVARTIAGIEKADTGSVSIEGVNLRLGHPRRFIDAGVVIVPGDRKNEGLLIHKSVAWNMTLPLLNKSRPRGILNTEWIQEVTLELISRLKVKTSSSDTVVSTLSGGNQQKVSIGRWLRNDPKVLILDEPTKGIDVGAKEEVFAVLRALVKEGKSVVYVSSEFQEISAMCDRALVMAHGRLVAQLSGSELSEKNLLSAAYEQYRNEESNE